MTDDPDRLGFFVIQFMRLSAVGFILLGAAIVAGKIHLPPALGTGLILLGAIEGLVLPALLARRWRRGG